jgi:hypothetical protein
VSAHEGSRWQEEQAAAAATRKRLMSSAADVYGVTADSAMPAAALPTYPGTIETATLADFAAAARRLKAAELEFQAAQRGYADAVKRLSEEATK